MQDLELEAELRELMDGTVFPELFDIVRVIDAKTGRLYGLEDGKLVDKQTSCTEAFGTVERCKNCTSLRAQNTNEHVVKIEYLDGGIFLFMSVPIVINRRFLVVELIKNIKKSIAGDLGDKYKMSESLQLVANYNNTATTDALTGLMNRQFVDEKLPDILKTSHYMRRPVSLALVSVDSLLPEDDGDSKQANDLVLKELAGALMPHSRRGTDFAARYSYNRFLFCFTGAPIKICREISGRLCERLGKKPIRYSDGKRLVTVSIGTAESFEIETPSQEALIAIAEQRQEQAAKMGKNIVV